MLALVQRGLLVEEPEAGYIGRRGSVCGLGHDQGTIGDQRQRSGPHIARPERQDVSTYVFANFSKLQVADRAEAIIHARDAGLGLS
jgi:hypothetical protein